MVSYDDDYDQYDEIIVVIIYRIEANNKKKKELINWKLSQLVANKLSFFFEQIR